MTDDLYPHVAPQRDAAAGIVVLRRAHERKVPFSLEVLQLDCVGPYGSDRSVEPARNHAHVA